MKCPNCGHEWQFSGATPSVSDDEIRAAYDKCNGNVAAAARFLGRKCAGIQLRAKKLGLVAKGQKFRRPDITDDLIKNALQEFGNKKLAAAHLGVSIFFLYNRIRDTKDIRDWWNSACVKRSHIKQHDRNLELAKAVVEAGGNFSGAAIILGLSRERVRQLWVKIPKDVKEEAADGKDNL